MVSFPLFGTTLFLWTLSVTAIHPYSGICNLKKNEMLYFYFMEAHVCLGISVDFLLLPACSLESNAKALPCVTAVSLHINLIHSRSSVSRFSLQPILMPFTFA